MNRISIIHNNEHFNKLNSKINKLAFFSFLVQTFSRRLSACGKDIQFACFHSRSFSPRLGRL